MLTLLAYANNR